MITHVLTGVLVFGGAIAILGWLAWDDIARQRRSRARLRLVVPGALVWVDHEPGDGTVTVRGPYQVLAMTPLKAIFNGAIYILSPTRIRRVEHPDGVTVQVFPGERG